MKSNQTKSNQINEIKSNQTKSNQSINQINQIKSNQTKPNQIKSINQIQSNPINEFNSIQFNSIQFNSIQFNSIQFNSIKPSQANPIQSNSIRFNPIHQMLPRQSVDHEKVSMLVCWVAKTGPLVCLLLAWLSLFVHMSVVVCVIDWLLVCSLGYFTIVLGVPA